MSRTPKRNKFITSLNEIYLSISTKKITHLRCHDVGRASRRNTITRTNTHAFTQKKHIYSTRINRHTYIQHAHTHTNTYTILLFTDTQTKTHTRTNIRTEAHTHSHTGILTHTNTHTTSTPHICDCRSVGGCEGSRRRLLHAK